MTNLETNWCAFKIFILYGNGRVLCAFQRKTRATITIKIFCSVLFMHVKVFSYMEQPFLFWNINGGHSKI